MFSNITFQGSGEWDAIFSIRFMAKEFKLSSDVKQDSHSDNSKNSRSDFGGKLSKDEGVDLFAGKKQGIDYRDEGAPHSGRRITDVKPSNEVNERLRNEYEKKQEALPPEHPDKGKPFHPPHEPDSLVFEYELDKDMEQAQVHSGETPSSRWSMFPEDAKDKDVSDLKNSFVIPGNPDKVTETPYKKGSQFEFGQAALQKWEDEDKILDGGGRQSYNIGKEQPQPDLSASDISDLSARDKIMMAGADGLTSPSDAAHIAAAVHAPSGAQDAYAQMAQATWNTGIAGSEEFMGATIRQHGESPTVEHNHDQISRAITDGSHAAGRTEPLDDPLRDNEPIYDENGVDLTNESLRGREDDFKPEQKQYTDDTKENDIVNEDTAENLNDNNSGENTNLPTEFEPPAESDTDLKNDSFEEKTDDRTSENGNEEAGENLNADESNDNSEQSQEDTEQPESESEQPESEPKKPEEETEQPETEPEQPESEPEQPESEIGQPEAEPEQSEAEPETEQPESETEQPEVEPKQPENESEQPKSEPEQPDEESEQAEEEPEQSETETEQPEAEPEQSETDTEQPESEPEQPESEPEQPETEPEQPEAEPEQPETEPEQPETEPEQPEVEPEQSETEPEKPESEPEQPETETEQPESDTEQPETDTEQPEPETEQPESELEQPESDTEQPESEPEQPESETEQQESEPEQPETEPEQPEVEPEQSEAEPEPSIDDSPPADDFDGGDMGGE